MCLETRGTQSTVLCFGWKHMANRVTDCQAAKSGKMPREDPRDETVKGDFIFPSNTTMKRYRLQKHDQHRWMRNQNLLVGVSVCEYVGQELCYFSWNHKVHLLQGGNLYSEYGYCTITHHFPRWHHYPCYFSIFIYSCTPDAMGSHWNAGIELQQKHAGELRNLKHHKRVSNLHCVLVTEATLQISGRICCEQYGLPSNCSSAALQWGFVSL